MMPSGQITITLTDTNLHFNLETGSRPAFASETS
jgi:hypothetical protein